MCHCDTFTVPSTVNDYNCNTVSTYHAAGQKLVTEALEAGYRYICARTGGGASASPTDFRNFLVRSGKFAPAEVSCQWLPSTPNCLSERNPGCGACSSGGP